MNQLLAIPESDPRVKVALDEGIYVEPRDKSPKSEIQRQNSAVNALRKLGLIVFAVPNSTRSQQSKLRQYREGAVYGAADLVIFWRGGVACIEMKDGTGSLANNQAEFLNRLHRRGHHVAVCRTTAGVGGWLAGIGAI